MSGEEAKERLRRIQTAAKIAPKFPRLRGMPGEVIKHFAKKKGTTITVDQADWLSRHADQNASVDDSSDEAIAANGPKA